jgi:hypothetical protein
MLIRPGPIVTKLVFFPVLIVYLDMYWKSFSGYPAMIMVLIMIGMPINVIIHMLSRVVEKLIFDLGLVADIVPRIGITASQTNPK